MHDTNTLGTIEYECLDCGIYVFNAGLTRLPDPQVCLTCGFIRTQPEDIQAELRKALHAER